MKITQLAKTFDRNAIIPDIENIAGLYPRGYLTIFASQAGTGKTWIMQYIACRLSCGGNILAGLEPRSPKYKSVIFAGETGSLLLSKRLQYTCWAYDANYIHVYDALELQRNNVPIMLNTPEGKETTLQIMDAERPDVIFYDTLISFHTADESKQGEMTDIYSFLMRVAKTFNCAVVANHHVRKRSTKGDTKAALTQDDVIGSSVGVRLASKVYIAEKLRDPLKSDEGMPRICVHDVKQWDKRLPDFFIQFYKDPATNRIDFAIEHGLTYEESEWSLRERIEKLINGYEVGAILTADTVTRYLVCSSDSARKYLDEFTVKGKLTRVKVANNIAWKVL